MYHNKIVGGQLTKSNAENLNNTYEETPYEYKSTSLTQNNKKNESTK